jgi:hypothetical protein
MPRRAAVLAYLVMMGTGAAMIAANVSVMITVVGAILVGSCLSPLSTFYSLQLDALSSPHRKAEVFALARTVHSIGIILSSANLALTSLAVTQLMSTTLIFAAAMTVGIVSFLGRRSRPR